MIKNKVLQPVAHKLQQIMKIGILTKQLEIGKISYARKIYATGINKVSTR